MKFTKLVLSGGGVKGYAMLGALDYIYEKYEVKWSEMCGTSIGSAIITLLALGYKPMDIFKKTLYIENVFDSFEATSFLNLYHQYGLFNIEKNLELLKDMIDPELTFEDFFSKSGILIKIIVSNITTMKKEICSHITTPQLSIFEAIKRSCNLPLVFSNIISKQNYYVDGGLVDNFPINSLEPISFEDKVLCVTATFSDELKKAPTSLFEYITRILILPISSRDRCIVEEYSGMPGYTIIDLKLDCNLVSNLTIEQKFDLFVKGKKISKGMI